MTQLLTASRQWGLFGAIAPVLRIIDEGVCHGASPPEMSSLILKGASVSRSSGQWRDDDYDVLQNGVIVGRIFFLDAVGPQGRPWMWASGPQRRDTSSGARLRAHARGGDGSVR
jgi:hypothetical protein